MRIVSALIAVLLLAGCALPAPTLPSIEPQGATTGAATHHMAPGVTARVTLTMADGVATLQGEARNEGSRTFQVSGICVPPWMARVRDKTGQDVAWEEPRAYCAAFGLKPFGPGAVETFSATWNGTLWQDGETRPAPAGDYLFSGRFTLWTGSGIEDPGEQVVLEPMVTVRIA